MTAISGRTPSSLSKPSTDLDNLVKMEDRKRPLHDHHDSSHPSKKQATSANGAGKSHRDDDMPWKDDLEKIQKDAILRQLGEYKRERKDNEAQISDLRKKAREHDDHLRTVDAWLKQLIDEVKNLMPAEDDVMDVDSAPSALQFTDQDKFKQHLQSHADNIRSLVERLSSRAQTFSPDVSELHAKVTKLQAAEKEYLGELEKLRTETSDLDERLQTASLRYMVAEKKLDRARSVTAAKVDKGLLLGGTKSNKDDPSAAKREESQANGVSENGEDTAELEADVKRNIAIVEKQQEQIAKLEEENATLTTKVTELTTRFASLTDEDYSKTELYKQLKFRHDDAAKKLNELEALATTLRADNAKFQSEQTTFQLQLESQSQALIKAKTDAAEQVSVDLARIRNHRDEVLADHNIKKVKLEERADSLQKLQDLTVAQQDRIKALESENERLSTQSSNLMSVASELDSMDADQLRLKVQEMEKKYSMLEGELTSMSSAYTKAQKLASQKVTDLAVLEEKATKAAGEKAKADQKYFAAMKSKDARDNEIKALRAQTGKSSEIVSSLKEADTTSRNLISNLEKQLSEVQSALTTKNTEHQSATRQGATQASEIARLNAQVTDLRNSLSSKDVKTASAATACRTAEAEVESLKSQLASTQKTLANWKSKSGQAEEHELLRQLAYCTVCRKELKDTVIKTCGHTFCHTCVDKVVQLRSRKCPNCGKPFGNNDHQRIVL